MSLDVEPVVNELAAAHRDPEALKTATMTFAVFVDDEQIAAWIQERTHALAEKHPSRVVIFDCRHDLEERRVESSGSRGEWVELGVRGASAAELDAALTQLQLPSAPVVLFWAAGPMAEDERFLALSRHARATICSSSLTRTDAEGLRDVTAFVEKHPGVALQDVSYLRLASWQELIAGFFDDPANRKELHALQRVELGAGSDAEMYYVLGWLASRLAWTPHAPGTLLSPSGPVHFAMTHEGPPRRLSRIVLASAHARYTAMIQPEDEGTICLQAETPSGKSMNCAPLHTVDLASLVERAILNTRARDAVFVESLAMARHILEGQAA